MTLPGVLVLGAPRDNILREIIFDIGVAPVFCQSILEAINALHRGSFEGIVVDCRTTDVDVLEFVLNIRDVDARIRIFVSSDDDADMVGLVNQSGVIAVDREKLAEELKEISQNVATRPSQTGSGPQRQRAQGARKD